VRLLVTTQTGNEYLAANRLEDRLPAVEATNARPRGLKGLVVVDVEGTLDRDRVGQLTEVEKVIPAQREFDEPDVHEIAEAAGDLADEIPEGSTFSVRCTRRGSHEFSSQDVERLGGAAVLDTDRDLEVDLSNPDKVLRVEIVHEWVGVGVIDGAEIHRKYVDKPNTRRLTGKTTIVQQLYESKDERGVKRIGAALGRSAQAFEVDRFVVALDEPTPASSVQAFVEALEDGIESRHHVQQGACDRSTDRVQVEVYDLHQMVRHARGQDGLIVMTDPRGEALANVRDTVGKRLVDADEVYLFNGSNRGLPTGCFSHADHVLDLAPSITYGTDQAVAAGLIGLASSWNP